MIVYKSRFLMRGEVWFDGEPTSAPVDWILYRNRSHPVPKSKSFIRHTQLLNLSLAPEELLRQMSKATVYQIKKAREQDHSYCEWRDVSDSKALDEFEDLYNQFARLKNLGKLDRPLLAGLAAAGHLEISVARNPEGKPLIYHAFFRDHHRCQVLHSASLYRACADSGQRNLLARANRLVIWTAALRMKALGLRLLDLGGWYTGTTDQARLAINQFKRSFGGTVVREYQCEQILTLKGWLVLKTAEMLNKIKGSQPLAAPQSESISNAPKEPREISPAI